MKNIIKARILIVFLFALTVMATIMNSIYAYNILKFIVPAIFMLSLPLAIPEVARKTAIAYLKNHNNEVSRIGSKESWIWNLPIISLLVIFGHWFLAILWLFSLGAFYQVRSAIKREKAKSNISI